MQSSCENRKPYRVCKRVCVYVINYLNFGFLGSRNNKWQQVCPSVRLGEKVGVEIILVLDLEDLRKTKQLNAWIQNQRRITQ